MNKRIIIFCEGQTEEAFVRDVLAPYFLGFDAFVTPIIFFTSYANNRKHKGGISNYSKAKNQIESKCKEDSTAIVTTLVDFYGLPDDWVGLEQLGQTRNDIYEQVITIEEAWRQDINCENFVPNLLLHEFEALLFSDMDKFNDWFDEDDVNLLTDEVTTFPTPEHVNNSKLTAPSKRILKHFADYQKPTHGSLIAQEIGLDVIREKCQHFNEWMDILIVRLRGWINR